jgi:hypothetical protein
MQSMYQLLMSSGGFSRTNNFRVELTLPSGLNDDYQSDLRFINMSCSASAIPGTSVDTARAQNGPVIKPEMVSGSFQQTLDLTFYISKDFRERLMFDAWKKLSVDEYSQRIGYYDDYVGEVNMYPMKRGSDSNLDDNSLLQCRLIKAFPKHIGSIQYAYDQENQIAMLPVTMSYLRYELV